MNIRELIMPENDMVSFFKDLQKNNPKFKNLRVHGDPEHDELRRQDQEKRDAERHASHQRAQDATARDHANLHQLESEYAKMLAKYKSLGGNGWQYADREQNLTSAEREARSMEHGLNHLHSRIVAARKHGEQGMSEEFDDQEYNDEAGMFKNNLQTITRVSTHLEKSIADSENLPEWCQEKIATAKGMIVAVMDYMVSQHEMGVQPTLKEFASAGATSAANIGTVDAPQLSPGKARGKRSYVGSPGKSGTKAPPQPKVVQPKTSMGTAVNALDMKANVFGQAKESIVIKRR